MNSYILTISCCDKRGIVAAVSGLLFNTGANIIDSAQFADSSTGQFFLRVEFAYDDENIPNDFESVFVSEVADKFGMQWQIIPSSAKPRVLIMVSKFGHCLNDLLHRMHTGTLSIEVPAIISNHNDMRECAERYGIEYYHMPMTDDKSIQESKVLEIIESEKIDLTVLARYMQVLSQDMCEKLEGRAINIHHSFLPSFKGARPYHQAFERGVKIIGATAHYVTSNLDEGPIIEQEVTRVDHSMKASDLTAAGRDIETTVLAKAVKYHTERRVLLNGNKTVVFR